MPFQLKKNTNASLPILMKRLISNNIIYFSEAIDILLKIYTTFIFESL